MMYVYVVMKIEDDEYGCRGIERMFAQHEDAEAYMAQRIAEEHADGWCDEHGRVEHWYGDDELFIIEEHEVH